MDLGLGRFPRRSYAGAPTQVEPLPRLSEHLGGPELYVKRDDRLALGLGGNKVRKLEFVVAEALAQGADTLITDGAIQSNHCFLTLCAAVREGLQCRLILEERVPGTYDEHGSGNNFLYHLLGAASIEVVPGGTDMTAAAAACAEAVRADGGRPYVIPGGASYPLGALGYVSAAEELLAQQQAAGLELDAIVCASGSAGTHAGLLAGLSALGVLAPAGRTRVVGINVRRARDEQEPRVRSLATGVAELLGHPQAAPDHAVECRDEWVGPGYSLPTPEMIEATLLAARLEALVLDPVYTGKTMAGLIGLIRAGELRAGQRVLFWHTGGAPALFAYQDVFEADPRFAEVS